MVNPNIYHAEEETQTMSFLWTGHQYSESRPTFLKDHFQQISIYVSLNFQTCKAKKHISLCKKTEKKNNHELSLIIK